MKKSIKSFSDESLSEGNKIPTKQSLLNFEQMRKEYEKNVSGKKIRVIELQELLKQARIEYNSTKRLKVPNSTLKMIAYNCGFKTCRDMLLATLEGFVKDTVSNKPRDNTYLPSIANIVERIIDMNGVSGNKGIDMNDDNTIKNILNNVRGVMCCLNHNKFIKGSRSMKYGYPNSVTYYVLTDKGIERLKKWRGY